MSVVRRGEKEQKLGAFLARHFAHQRDAEPRPGREIMLIARSAQSPVVKALAAFAPEIATAGHTVRMIVARADREPSSGGAPIGAKADVKCEVRWAKNPRLIEAHEQLVLGADACWMGDSMRRDPARCDAYESFVEGCSELADSARVAFERLWIASEPLLAPPRGPHAPAEPAGAAPRQ
jgi:hypothetical protein